MSENRRITKRVRKDAILTLLIAASANDDKICVDKIADTPEASWLAERAFFAVPSDGADCAQDEFAEAAALLESGWNPGERFEWSGMMREPWC